MKIVNEKPPIYDRALEVFDLRGKRPIFTYGDTIYNPFNGGIDEPLIAHEAVHCRQQGDDPAAWWERYFTDERFRYEQELDAYREQYRVAKRFYKDRNHLNAALMRWASDLSGPMYGNVGTQRDALEKIKA